MKKILFVLASFFLAAIPYVANCQWSLTGNSGTTPGTNFLGTTDAKDIVFKTNSGERMRLVVNGNFLIGGSTDNGYKLDVNGTAWFQNSIRIGSFALTKGVNSSALAVNQGIRVDDAPSTAIRFQTSNQGALADNFVFENTFGVVRSVFTNASIVHITQGWGDPNTTGFNLATLRIDNEINNTSGTPYTIRGIYYNPTVTSLGTSTHIAFENTSGNNRLNSTSGNTLIGTSTDDGTSKLQVNGTTKTGALIVTTGASAGKVLTSDATGNATWQTAGTSGWGLTGNTGTTNKLGLTDANPLSIITSNTERIRIAAAGNVGIGTANIGDANYKLFVETGIRTRKIKVDQLTWPDYVFHRTYVLRPLTEVEKFIEENKHLPEMPSAAEVEKNGLDLGDNQALLLKKIEELTLYIIEQNKRMAQLEKQVQLLQKSK